mmetsp:Transcript_90530/g.207215  ORF Transcript_90530/g.207215 Transcript_90530/m.207215 type:complete len:250 (+) Transcript_90530:103-852(+)
MPRLPLLRKRKKKANPRLQDAASTPLGCLLLLQVRFCHGLQVLETLAPGCTDVNMGQLLILLNVPGSVDFKTLLIEIPCHMGVRVLRHVVKHRGPRPRRPLPRLPLRPGEHEGALIPIHREHSHDTALNQVTLFDGFLGEGPVAAPGVGLDVDLAHVHSTGDGAIRQGRRRLRRSWQILMSLGVLLDVRLSNRLQVSEALPPRRTDVHMRQLLLRRDIPISNDFEAVVLEITLHVRVRVLRHVVEHRRP